MAHPNNYNAAARVEATCRSKLSRPIQQGAHQAQLSRTWIPGEFDHFKVSTCFYADLVVPSSNFVPDTISAEYGFDQRLHAAVHLGKPIPRAC